MEYRVSIASRPDPTDADVREMVRAAVAAAGGLESVVGPGDSVLLKPNLVVDKPSSSGATTDPRVVAAVADLVLERRPASVLVAESAGLGFDTGRAYQVSGVDRVCEERGIPFIDLRGQPTAKVPVGGAVLDEVAVYRQALEHSVIVDLPVLKAHCQTRVTLGIKNVKGLIPDREKRRFHAQGLHRAIADLATVIRPAFTLIDGICGDLTFEEGGTPVRMNTLVAGRNTLAVDLVAASLLGYAADEVSYLQRCIDLGLGPRSLDQVQVTHTEGPGRGIPRRDELQARNRSLLSSFPVRVEEAGACSTCLGALIHALQRCGDRGHTVRGTIRLGQNLSGPSAMADLRVGACAKGSHGRHVPGCPPRAADILRALLREP